MNDFELPKDMNFDDKIVLTGVAGLVGQNLAILLKTQGYKNLVGIDKHHHNVQILRQLNPEMTVIEEDLANPRDWTGVFAEAKAVVILQAQIGGETYADFTANNIEATQHVLEACQRHGVEYLVHISSSVINSMAKDYYTETKKAQEQLVRDSGIPHCILRPTLMFGWFDRKHLGWLSRFMKKTPIFPIPGSGHYLRQPLYILDFCRIIAACLQTRPDGETYNISGMEEIDYIDIIRAIKKATQSRTPIVRIPYWLFWSFLKTYGLFDKNPPFTTQQLAALVTPDRFEVIPWDELFGVQPTPFNQAIAETFCHPQYSEVTLQF